MSGIAGIIHFDGAPVEPGQVEKMTAAMAHRGPDGIHHWVKGSVVLGQCMLRTTPESLDETQPLAMAKTGSTVDSAGKGYPQPSDRSIKQNIIKVGDHPLGISLYLFDYKPQYQHSCDQGRQFGVMADEVELVMPEAVSVHPDGFKQVDYAKLGITHTIH